MKNYFIIGFGFQSKNILQLMKMLYFHCFPLHIKMNWYFLLLIELNAKKDSYLCIEEEISLSHAYSNLEKTKTKKKP